ncbi:MAG: 4-hydroxythreonine-4-phosphate dehydrogenase PdxA [Bacteriovoracaceae bacterium]
MKDTLQRLNLSGELAKNQLSLLNSRLTLKLVEERLPLTTEALFASLDDMSPQDILLTLPSSKDQITSRSGAPFKGHTDFLRSAYSDPDITMNFLAPRLTVALLTDHIALREVEQNITRESIERKISLTIREIKPIRNIDQVFFSGVNPHCGENGIISGFDKVIGEGIDLLRPQFPHIKFYGPFAGDTVLFNQCSPNNLFVFASHDQGLAPFKLMNGLTGINLTLGLPFKRVSVDHGTAFDLYGLNKANYQGMLYLMDEAIKWT